MDANGINKGAPKAQIWVGTKEGLGDALAEAYKNRSVSPVDSTMDVLGAGVLRTEAISKWCGIEKPSTDTFNLRAPDGCDGTARWIEYESGWSAPETKIYALRIE